jgi:single-strand DNA-binding protein
MKTSMRVIGNLGKDAILNNVNGKSVINFSVASTEKYKDAQGTIKESTLWVDCSYWSEKTGLVPYLKKGSQVFVEGKPDVRSYTTTDGRTGATLVLRVTSILLLGSKNENVAAPPANIPSNEGSEDIKEPIEDLPF